MNNTVITALPIYVFLHTGFIIADSLWIVNVSLIILDNF